MAVPMPMTVSPMSLLSSMRMRMPVVMVFRRPMRVRVPMSSLPVQTLCFVFVFRQEGVRLPRGEQGGVFVDRLVVVMRIPGGRASGYRVDGLAVVHR